MIIQCFRRLRYPVEKDNGEGVDWCNSDGKCCVTLEHALCNIMGTIEIHDRSLVSLEWQFAMNDETALVQVMTSPLCHFVQCSCAHCDKLKIIFFSWTASIPFQLTPIHTLTLDQGEERIFSEGFETFKCWLKTTLDSELVLIFNYTSAGFSIKQPSKNREATLGIVN